MERASRIKTFGRIAGIIGKILLSQIGLNDFANKKELVGTPEVGKWYAITPEGARGAKGDPWHGLIKLGTENKVIVYFLGGGVSTDSYTAARSHSVKDGYYNEATRNLDFIVHSGISGAQKTNPFRDWTVLVMQYATGDFHCGDGQFPYKNLKGEDAVLYHYGYRDYTAFMKAAMKFVPQPDELLIAGFSAGGFGVSLLADDVVTHYFPNQKKFTVLVDSSVLLYDKWRETAEQVWHAPKEISDRLVANNLTLDSLKALSEKYRGRVQILFDCSKRDGALANHQGYLLKGEKTWTKEDGDYIQSAIREMAEELLKLPDTGVFLWDGLPFDSRHPGFTMHTILGASEFDTKAFYGITIARWLTDAIGGDVRSYGLELIHQ